MTPQQSLTVVTLYTPFLTRLTPLKKERVYTEDINGNTIMYQWKSRKHGENTVTHPKEVLTISSLLKHTCPPSGALLKSKLTTTPFLILTLDHNSQISSSSSVPQINNYGCCLPVQKVVGSTYKTNTNNISSISTNTHQSYIHVTDKVNTIKPSKVRHDVQH